MTASSTTFKDTLPQDIFKPQAAIKGAKTCIRLLGPVMPENKLATKIYNNYRDQAFESHGCKVITIGNGIRDLTSHDVDTLHKTISDSPGNIILEINTHGGTFGGEHVIELGKDFYVSTKNLLTSLLKHAGDKKVGILSGACESGQFCNESEQLPVDYLGLSDKNVNTLYDHLLSNVLFLNSSIDLTVANILKLSLTQNFTLPKDEGTIPHLCTKQSNINLEELLKSHSGVKFSNAEKDFITKELSPFLNDPDRLPIILHKIENNEINENTRHSDTKIYGEALAAVFTAQQYHELTPNPVKEDDKHSNIALKIYQDLMHIRDYTLYHDFTKQAPKLLKLPFISFLAAMSSNQHSEHPVRDSVVDIGVESAALTAMGLSIGNAPAAVALFASHVAEKGLEHFPSWDQIDKMPRTTTQERLAFSRMIEARATAELLAMPSKATEIISRYVKSVIDSVLVKIDSFKDLPKPNALAAPSQFLPPRVISPTFEKQRFSLTTDKPVGLTLFSSLPHSDLKLLGSPKLPDFTSTQTDRSKIHFQLPKQETKAYLSTPLPKLTGLSDGLAPKTSWDTLRTRSTDVSLPIGFSLQKAPLTGWDKLATSEFRSEFFSPSKAFGLSRAADFQSTSVSNNFSLPGVSSSLLTEPNMNPIDSHSSKPLFQTKFTQQPCANGWDKLKDKGSFNVKGFSK